MNIPVIFLTTENDFDVLKQNILKIREKISSSCYYVIANRSLKSDIELLNCNFIDENSILEGLNIQTIRDLLSKRECSSKRAGWYFQQFLKMAVCYYLNTDLYLIWDGDTVPLRDYTVNPDELYFDVKTEYHKPYFETMKRIFPYLYKKFDFSFISEHMIVKSDIMKQLIQEIEVQDSIKGNTFYEKIINSINLEDLSRSGFSEFETYGNYAMYHNENLYKIRQWKSLRAENDWLFSTDLKPYLVRKVSKTYDAVSFDEWENINRLKNLFYKFFLLFFDLSFINQFYKIISYPSVKLKAIIRKIYLFLK